MNRIALFSISTNDFVHNAKVALDSFVDHNDHKNNIDVFNISLKDIKDRVYKNINIDRICFRYKDDLDVLRWALKPAFILYFLEEQKYQNVIYIDNDIYFVNNNTFILDLLDRGVLLTKHNRPLYPSCDEIINDQFLCNFVHGFFNAGFVAASQKGLSAINWWLRMNLWQCCKNITYGLYDDQKYLDTLALEFSENVRICDHPGCNLARWNTHSAIRSFQNGKWKINNTYDPIFCHFGNMKYDSDDSMLLYFKQEYLDKIVSSQ